MKSLFLSASVVLALAATTLPAAAQEGTPRATDDACPETRVPGSDFWDVPGTVHEKPIDCVVWWDVAAGNSLVTYGPGASVTRGQMATFIAKVIGQSGGELPAQPRDHFSDDNGNPHERAINQLAEAEIVGGVGGGRYAPGAPVNRAQMATFLVLAYQYRSDAQLSESRDYFTDDNGNTHESNINKAAEAGFTGGVAGGGYAPSAEVSRGQMASFLARVLDLVVEQTDATPPAEANRRLSGTGADVINGSIPGDKLAIARIEHTGGESNFQVWAVDDKGEKADLLVNEIGEYSGTVDINFGYTPPLRGIDINADGDWSIVILPADWARDLGTSGGQGTGDEVVDASRLAGATVRLTHDGESNFQIWAYDADGDTIDLIVNEIGAYEGTHRVPNDTVWFEVTADGNWTVTRQ